MGVAKGQGHTMGPVSYQLTSFSFHINQTNNSWDKSYFKIWPWNIQGQGHEWGQRSRSNIVPSIRLMHFLFVSHQSDQLFLRYGQNSVWPWKNTSYFFSRKFAKITVSNRTSPKSSQVMTMARAIKLPRFVVIWWVVLTSSRRQANFW